MKKYITTFIFDLFSLKGIVALIPGAVGHFGSAFFFSFSALVLAFFSLVSTSTLTSTSPSHHA